MGCLWDTYNPANKPHWGSCSNPDFLKTVGVGTEPKIRLRPPIKNLLFGSLNNLWESKTGELLLKTMPYAAGLANSSLLGPCR